MSSQVHGTKIVAQGHPNDPRHVAGSKLWDFTAAMRRRGIVCHFGANRDPSKLHCS